jgi:hypothetical protein
MCEISKWTLPVQTPMHMFVPFIGKLPKEPHLRISSFICRKRAETHNRYISISLSNLLFTDYKGDLHGKWKWRFHEQSDLCWWKLWVRVSELPTRKIFTDYSAYLGNQQFTGSQIVFVNCKTAVQIHWDWAWTMQDVVIESCGSGIVVTGGVSILLYPTYDE